MIQPEPTQPAPLAAGLEDALIVLDEHGVVVFANAAAAPLLGADQLGTADAIAARLDLAPEDAAPFDGRAKRVEGRLRDVESETWLELAVYPVPGTSRGGGADRTIVIGRDVSRSRRSRQMREAFASIVAHELRTPVTTIYGGAQLLADATVTEATRHEAAASIAREADRLYWLVEDLLILARFDQPVVVADEPVLLQRFLATLVASEAVLASTAIDLRVADDLAAVAGRQGYIEQVLHHLLLDAVRLSHGPGTVSVVARRTSEGIEVVVGDSGPTVDAAEAASLFELFHRSTRTVSDASGANLGLFVCSRLVEAMGGRIWARPRPRGGGMEIAFLLQVAEGQE